MVDALLADRPEQFVDAIDHSRGKTERRLVEHNEPRSRQQRARNGELLLFAAGQQPGGLTSPLGKNWKHGEQSIDVGRHGFSVAPGRRAEQQIFGHRQTGENVPALRHQRDAVRDHILERNSAERLAAERYGRPRRA